MIRPTPPRPPAGRLGAARPLLLVLIGVLLGLVGRALVERYGGNADDRRAREFERALALVEQTFVQPLERQDLYEGALRGIVGELDPYSRFYDRSETTRLERETTGQYDGIGVLFAPVEDPWQILFPLPDSPAEKAGLKVGDRLLTIAGQDASQLEFAEIRELLGDGDAGSVELEVENREGERRTASVTPARVLDPSIRRIRLIERDGPDVGYLSIGSFTRRTAGEFDIAVTELRARGAESLVIDLRGNLGGVLDAALAIADRFVPEGALLQTDSRSGVDVAWSSREATLFDGLPVAVLLDGSSASASEVLAGALQDHRVGVLVGEPSYGKGTVQTLTSLPRLQGVLRVTTSVYRTPSGRLIERSLPGAWDAGLTPDLEIAPDEETRAPLYAYLASFGPRLEHQLAVAAWEQESGLELVRPHPEDSVLDAALELLAGRRPSTVAAAMTEEAGG